MDWGLWLKDNWAAIAPAIWQFVTFGIVVFAAGWTAGRFAFRERIELQDARTKLLQARIEQRDEEIQLLRSPARRSLRPKDALDTVRIAREIRTYGNLFLTWDRIFHKGMRSLGGDIPNTVDMRPAVESYESILTTLEKMGFIVPRLDFKIDPIGYIKMAVEFADMVSPLLLRDHAEEAKAASRDIVDNYKHYQANKMR